MWWWSLRHPRGAMDDGRVCRPEPTTRPDWGIRGYRARIRIGGRCRGARRRGRAGLKCFGSYTATTRPQESCCVDRQTQCGKLYIEPCLEPALVTQKKMARVSMFSTLQFNSLLVYKCSRRPWSPSPSGVRSALCLGSAFACPAAEHPVFRFGESIGRSMAARRT